MLVFWTVTGVVLGLLLVGLLCMLTAAVRVRSDNPLDPKRLAGGSRAAYVGQITDGIAWLETHTTEEIWLRSFDGLRLFARFCPVENARGTVLRMHGYHSEGRVDISCMTPYYHKLGFNLLVVDQRSHGRSDGRLITYGIKERYDCQLWANYLAQRFGPAHPIVLSGISMGASTVLMASSLPLPDAVRCIVADCGFTRPFDIVRGVMKSRFHLPVPFVYLADFWFWLLSGHSLRSCAATDCVRSTKLPVFFLHGTADRFVPWEMSQQNFDACAGEKQLLLIEGAAHGLSFLTDPARCQAALEPFLARFVPEIETHEFGKVDF